MGSKYYTPKIEEFHVGFEYYIKHYHKFTDKVNEEYLNNEDNFDWIVQSWKPHMVMAEQFNVIEYRWGRAITVSVPESVKVKYLDKEDIESLGFIHNKKIGNVLLDVYKFHKDDFLRLSCKYNNNVPVINVYHYEGWETPDLIIKNKSELKKLLIQLSILEDGE